jgi:translation initiation factor 2B subunit (eIF-2B alpha/beta/delta family)
VTDSDTETVGVVTCFLRHDAHVFLLRRSDEAGSDSGPWGAVAGHAEGDPGAAARRAIGEGTGLDPESDVTLVREGDPFPVEDRDRATRLPHLFDAATRDVEVNYETAEYAWVPPAEIRRRETVPGLWRSYDRVRPSVETVASDREHGSAYVSVRAIEVLRDEAAVASDGVRGGDRDPDDEREGGRGERVEPWNRLGSLADQLREARPSMAVVENRINRAMDAASGDRTPASVEAAAEAGIERALAADGEAAAVAADRAGSHVATLSRSGTVLRAVEETDPASVVVAESRPGREGIATAESLAERTDASVTLTTDAAFAGELVDATVDTLLVGADAVLPDGRVVNKVGTRGAATVAAREGIDCYAVAASDKITYREGFDPEARPDDLYDGGADLAAANPTFEATPADLFDAVVTERGPLDGPDLRELAAAHEERARWTDGRY